MLRAATNETDRERVSQLKLKEEDERRRNGVSEDDCNPHGERKRKAREMLYLQ